MPDQEQPRDDAGRFAPQPLEDTKEPSPRAPSADERGLAAIEDDIKQSAPPAKEGPPSPDYELRFEKLTSAYERTQEQLGQITELLGRLAEQPRQTERVIERQATPPQTPKWREKLAPEHADTLAEAIREEAERLFLKRREAEIDPAFVHILQQQDRLMERALAAEYPDEDFGFESLKDDVLRYRRERNNQITLDQAYQDVYFRESQKALRSTKGAQREQIRHAKQDDADGGKPSARPGGGDDGLTPEERTVARGMYPELEPAKADAYYFRHKQGMTKERHSVLQKRDLV